MLHLVWGTSMVAVYSTSSKEYTVSKCTLADIEEHYAIIGDKVQDTDEEAYKGAMEVSVEQGYAYKAEVNGEVVSFIYIRKVINTWLGCSIWSGDMIGLILVLKEFTDVEGFKRIKYAPHEGMLAMIKSMVTSKSLRLYHNGNEYLVISTAEVADKMERLYDRLGVTKCLQ